MGVARSPSVLSLSFVSRKVERRRRRLIGLSEAPPAEGANQSVRRRSQKNVKWSTTEHNMPGHFREWREVLRMDGGITQPCYLVNVCTENRGGTTHVNHDAVLPATTTTTKTKTLELSLTRTTPCLPGKSY